MAGRKASFLVYAVAAILFMGLFVDVAMSALKIDEVQVVQSHTKDFWQINGDDAGTQSGELAFIWLEWDSFPSYHYVTIYNLLVNNTYTEYTPCDEQDSCSQRLKVNRKHAGKVDMGYIAIPNSSFTNYLASSPLTRRAAGKPVVPGAEDQVDYYNLSWYSFPREGACPNQNSMGLQGCGFYDRCAVKSITRGCLEAKHGWKKAIDSQDYFSLWPIFVLAFQENDLANGGCPDVTAGNFTICPNAPQLLKKKETYGGVTLPPGEKVPRILPSKSNTPSASSPYSSYSDSPLIGVDVQNNSVCQILDDSNCKPLLAFEPPLSEFATASILSYSVKGLVFFHLHSKPGAGCTQAPRIIAYEFESNSWVLNFTIDYNLKWFAVDNDDNSVIGIFSNDAEYLRVNLVQISLNSPHEIQQLTTYAIYNTSNEVAKQIAYDDSSNTIYFPGTCPYMGWPTFVSYTLNSPTQTAFPIVTLNQTVYSMTFVPETGALLGLSLNGLTWIGQLDPATGIFFPNLVTQQTFQWEYGESTLLAYDSLSNSLTFCVKKGGSYSLATFDLTSQTVSNEIQYPCMRFPYAYVSSST